MNWSDLSVTDPRIDAAKNYCMAQHLHAEDAGLSGTPSEKTAWKTQAKQWLKAAAELDKGNLPHPVAGGWIVESRSTLIGKIVGVQIGPDVGGMVLKLALDSFTGRLWGQDVDIPVDQMRLQLYVQGGDCYHYHDSEHRCECEAGLTGCWHGCLCEAWKYACEMAAQAEEPYELGPLDPLAP